MYHDMHGWGYGGGVLMMIVGLLLVALVVFGAARLAIRHERQIEPPQTK